LKGVKTLMILEAISIEVMHSFLTIYFHCQSSATIACLMSPLYYSGSSTRNS